MATQLEDYNDVETFKNLLDELEEEEEEGLRGDSKKESSPTQVHGLKTDPGIEIDTGLEQFLESQSSQVSSPFSNEQELDLNRDATTPKPEEEAAPEEGQEFDLNLDATTPKPEEEAAPEEGQEFDLNLDATTPKPEEEAAPEEGQEFDFNLDATAPNPEEEAAPEQDLNLNRQAPGAANYRHSRSHPDGASFESSSQQAVYGGGPTVAGPRMANAQPGRTEGPGLLSAAASWIYSHSANNLAKVTNGMLKSRVSKQSVELEQNTSVINSFISQSLMQLNEQIDGINTIDQSGAKIDELTNSISSQMNVFNAANLNIKQFGTENEDALFNLQNKFEAISENMQDPESDEVKEKMEELAKMIKEFISSIMGDKNSTEHEMSDS